MVKMVVTASRNVGVEKVEGATSAGWRKKEYGGGVRVDGGGGGHGRSDGGRLGRGRSQDGGVGGFFGFGAQIRSWEGINRIQESLFSIINSIERE